MAENEKKDTGLEEAKSEKTAKPAKAKSKKPSLGSRIAAWFRSVKAEMKKIVWASFKTVRSNTLMVAVAVLVFAAAIGIVDFIFSKFIYILGILI